MIHQRTQIILVVFICLFLPMDVFALDMGQEDKQKHFAVSNAIAGPAYLTMRSKNFSKVHSVALTLALTLLVGQAKEMQDARYDYNDMGANAIGALSGIVLPLHFSF